MNEEISKKCEAAINSSIELMYSLVKKAGELPDWIDIQLYSKLRYNWNYKP